MHRSARLFLKISIFLASVLAGQASPIAEFESNANARANLFQVTQGVHFYARGLEEPPNAQSKPEHGIQPTSPSPLQLEANNTSNAGNKADPSASKLTPQEEQAGKLFELIIQMGVNLEVVTSLGSNASEIVQDSTKVMEMVPQIDSLRKNLLAEVPKKTEELTAATQNATKAGEELAASLKAIQQKPEDANLIKQHYKVLEKSFKAILQASDGVATAAIPRLAELVAAEKKVASEAGAAKEGPGVKGKEEESGKESGVLKIDGSEAGKEGAGLKVVEAEAGKEGAESKAKESGPKLAVLPKKIVDEGPAAHVVKPVGIPEAKEPDAGKEVAAPKPEEAKPTDAQAGEQKGAEKTEG